jgi:hypothetical protein
MSKAKKANLSLYLRLKFNKKESKNVEKKDNEGVYFVSFYFSAFILSVC